MTHVARRRLARTYVLDGREVYADTGRAVDERLGSHVVLWIVDDAEAWAQSVEAEGDAELGRWSRAQRATAEARRAQAYDSAAQIRSAGRRRDVRGHHHRKDRAAAEVAGLRASHPNPGVRYEVAEITAVSACADCHQPIIKVDGRWCHHLLRYPVECGAGAAASRRSSGG